MEIDASHDVFGFYGIRGLTRVLLLIIYLNYSNFAANRNIIFEMTEKGRFKTKRPHIH